jgi:hypothetical protein
MVDRCLEKSQADGQIDAIHELAQPYPLKVFPDAVGLEPGARENLLIYGDMVFNSMGPRNELLAKSAERVGEVTQWIMKHCQRENLRPGGFGDQIYQAADAGEIDPANAPMLVRSFLSPVSTPPSTGSAMRCTRWRTTRNSTRCCTPTQRWRGLRSRKPCGGNRPCKRSSGQPHTTRKLRASLLRENTKVLCMLASANRDPRKWPSQIATTSSGGRPGTWRWARESTVAWARP